MNTHNKSLEKRRAKIARVSAQPLWLQTEKDRSMEDYQLLVDLHKNANRQGPGGDSETEKALSQAMIDRAAPLKIADIGCGTGASSLMLARLLNAQITAVDFLQDFLEVLEGRAKNMGLSEKITTLCCSMDNLPFGKEEYDVIWSEGAIYNMGFERGVVDWNHYLKAGYWSFPRLLGLQPPVRRNSRNIGMANIPKSMLPLQR